MANSRNNNTTQSSVTQAPFKIDPEFANKIPPIGAEEYEQLEGNIILAGEVFDPLVVWDEANILVDGHNRWKIIQTNPGIAYKVRRMSFPDKWAAFEWMYMNQLGRRNLTNEQRKYAIGKMYEARKKSVGAPEGNVNAKQCAQSEHIEESPRRVSEQIAKEIGVGKETVKRSEKFAKGVDAIREVSPEAAEKVLTGKANVPNVFVQQIGQMEPEKVEAAADIILNGMKAPKVTKPRQRMSDEDRENIKAIEAIVADMYDPTTAPEFTIDLLIDDIEVNAEIYVELLANTLKDRQALVTDENKPRIVSAINKVVENILKVRDSM